METLRRMDRTVLNMSLFEDQDGNILQVSYSANESPTYQVINYFQLSLS